MSHTEFRRLDELRRSLTTADPIKRASAPVLSLAGPPRKVAPKFAGGPGWGAHSSPTLGENATLTAAQDVVNMLSGDASRAPLRSMTEVQAGVISRGLELRTHAIREFLPPQLIPMASFS